MATLYCDLASLGLLKHFCKSAQRLGFSNEEIADTGEYYGEKLRKSKLYKYIKKLNGNLQIRPLISDDKDFLQNWISLIADPEIASAATMNWSRQYSYNVVYAKNGFVSFYCREGYYTGGAHENHNIKVGTLYRGKELRLADDGIAGAFKPKTVPVQEDPKKDIFEYWKNLAKTGDAEAQNNLGLLYCSEHGTEKDEELALKYFQLAAKQGHADAQENLRLLKEAIAAEKVLNKRSQNKE